MKARSSPILLAVAVALSVCPSLAAQTNPTPAGVAAAHARTVVDSLGAIGLRVNPGDTIFVRKTSGKEVTGKFSRASEAVLTVKVGGQTQEIPVGDVQQVSRRGANRVHEGMLIGFLAGAVVGISG
jgi:hypothetical protein